MPTSLILNPELLQEAIDLNTDTPIETLVETALRAYIDHYRSLKTDASPSFGESIVAFREKHNISQMDIDPDEIWGDIRDRNFVGTILLQQAGAFANDPTLEEIRDQIYANRGRSEIE